MNIFAANALKASSEMQDQSQKCLYFLDRFGKIVLVS